MRSTLAATVGPYVMGDVADRVAHTDVPDPERAMATAMAIHCEAAGMLGGRLGHGGLGSQKHCATASSDGTEAAIQAA
jgi:hypothetical protein